MSENVGGIGSIGLDLVINTNNLKQQFSAVAGDAKKQLSAPVEELGKSIMVTSGIVDFLGDNIDWKTFWKRLRNHKDKTGTIEHIENIFISNDENFCNPKDVQDRIPTFEEVKMISLYSDMIQNDFYEPCEIIQEEMVQAYHKLTGKRIDFVTAIAVSDFTLRNIDKEKAKEHIKWLKSFFRKE